MRPSSVLQSFSLRQCCLGMKTVLAGFIGLLLIGCAGKQAAAPPPPPDVEVAEVEQRDVPIYGEWIATLDGYVNAQIQPQVTGYLWKQNYREGAAVHRQDVLFEIDPRPFEAIVQQTKGQLAQTEAQLSKASLDVQRD